MVHHVTPPPAIPLASMSKIVEIVRNGQVRDNAGCLYWSCMDCLAYGGGIVFGPPDGHAQANFGSIGDEQEQIAECCAALEEAHVELQAFGASAGEDSAGLDPATLAVIIQAIALAIELFKRFRR